jgi:flagellar motor switch protein FliM
MTDGFDDQPSDFLDQSEIDRLLAETPADVPSRQLVIRGDGKRWPAEVEPRVDSYDFRNPAFLSEVELRQLRLIQEDFVRYLSARLSMFLRMEFGLKMARLTTVSYDKFTEALPSPTHICLFKIEPLAGVGILDLNPRLALTITDRILGGRGVAVKAERYLTEIEITLIEDVVMIVLEEWCGQWRADQDLHPQIIGHESNGRFLQTSPRDAVVLELLLEATFGDCSEQMRLGVPYYTIEPMVKKLQAQRQQFSGVGGTAKRATWQKSYDNISLPVAAEWKAIELSLRDVANFRVGDVLELPASLLHETRLLLNGTPKFVGTVGQESDRVVVQLTRKVSAAAVDGTQLKSDGRKNP